jgi:hypothetical protein
MQANNREQCKTRIASSGNNSNEVGKDSEEGEKDIEKVGKDSEGGRHCLALLTISLGFHSWVTLSRRGKGDGQV